MLEYRKQAIDKEDFLVKKKKKKDNRSCKTYIFEVLK